MLTLEQYRDPKMAKLYQNYLAEGPLRYMEAVFSGIVESGEDAKQLAMDFYGPIFLLYSIYDGAENKQEVVKQVEEHVEKFAKRFQKMLVWGEKNEQGRDGVSEMGILSGMRK